MNVIPRMKSLKYFSICHVKLSQEEIDTIRESLPKLIRFKYRLEGDNNSDDNDSDDDEEDESNENGKYFPYHIFITLAIFLFIRIKT